MSDDLKDLIVEEFGCHPYFRDLFAEVDRLRAELSARTNAHHAAEKRELAALAELDEVRAELARCRAWIDAVMAQPHADVPLSSTQLIIRPQPLEVKP